MDSSTSGENGNEILHDFAPFIRVYKDGRLERLVGNDVVPAGVDPDTGVQSKDVAIAKETSVSARLYIPKATNPNEKLPLLIYFHGGAFVAESAFSPTYHKHINLLVSQANIVVVSVEYRLAPEYPLPIAYQDSSYAIKWVASHSWGDGHEPWLKEHADFGRVFLGGDSAGGNIAHKMAMQVGSENPGGVKLEGIILNHPFFGGNDPIVGDKPVDIHIKAYLDKLWAFAKPETSGSDDPDFNPGMDPNLSSLGCRRVLVSVAEKDFLRDRGWNYYQILGKSGWKGNVEIMESKGENHVFFLFAPTSDNALAFFKRMVSFINQDNT